MCLCNNPYIPCIETAIQVTELAKEHGVEVDTLIARRSEKPACNHRSYDIVGHHYVELIIYVKEMVNLHGLTTALRKTFPALSLHYTDDKLS